MSLSTTYRANSKIKDKDSVLIHNKLITYYERTDYSMRKGSLNLALQFAAYDVLFTFPQKLQDLNEEKNDKIKHLESLYKEKSKELNIALDQLNELKTLLKDLYLNSQQRISLNNSLSSVISQLDKV
jgi:hypothetical protein